MKIAVLTNEYPPNVYGGAGVHVGYLVRYLSSVLDRHDSVEVLCFGDQRHHSERLNVNGISLTYNHSLPNIRNNIRFMDTMLRNAIMWGAVESADIIHCHTWYTHLAGCLLKQSSGAPLVLTTHSLEPHRQWKQEQLGTAYKASRWIERIAYENADGVIAISDWMRKSVCQSYAVPYEKVRVIHNGIDIEEYRPMPDYEVLHRYHIDPDAPFILFVGRVSRQKGIMYLIRAIKYIDPDVQIVLCLGASDTDRLDKEVMDGIEHARADTSNRIILIRGLYQREILVSLYTHASVFISPSVYEPFGLTNLEAMACGTPVVAAQVGGIPELVVHNENGLLVPFDCVSPDNAEPQNPEEFSQNLASAANILLQSPERISAMGASARQLVENSFSWESTAKQVVQFYRDLVDG